MPTGPGPSGISLFSNDPAVSVHRHQRREAWINVFAAGLVEIDRNHHVVTHALYPGYHPGPENTVGHGLPLIEGDGLNDIVVPASAS